MKNILAKISYMTFGCLLMLPIYFGGSIVLAQDITERVEKALAAVVFLEMTDTLDLPVSYGSGFFVSPTHVVTNFNNVAGTTNGTVIFKRKKYPIQGIVAVDPENDLALLEVNIPDVKLPPLGDSEKVQVSEAVYVVGPYTKKTLGDNTGNAFRIAREGAREEEVNFTDGIISHIKTQGMKNVLQMTAPVEPWDSGSPVLNSEGKVIGITFKTIEAGQKRSFAIPSKYIKLLLDNKGSVIPFTPSEENISAEEYYSRGFLKYHQGLYKLAILYHDSAIRLKPHYVDAYSDRAQAKEKLGQYAEAIKDYDTIIQLRPDNPFIYGHRGRAKYELKLYKPAILDYDTAIQLASDAHRRVYGSIYSNRGEAKAELGQYEDAIKDFDVAMSLDLNLWAQAYSNRGEANAELGQYEDAIKDYTKAIKVYDSRIESYQRRESPESGQHIGRNRGLDTLAASAYFERGLAKVKQDLLTALQLATQADNVKLKKQIEDVLRLLK